VEARDVRFGIAAHPMAAESQQSKSVRALGADVNALDSKGTL
jgi:hypothetical protein